MKKNVGLLLAVCGLILIGMSCQKNKTNSVTVPIILDHNRMLFDAEIQRKDGTWRKARLWVDTGNPDLIMTRELALDLGFDLSEADSAPAGTVQQIQLEPLSGVRIGKFPLDFSGLKSNVLLQAGWLFGTMHCDANLPSAVMKNYQIIFDYPGRKLTIANPGMVKPKGIRTSASVHPQTGIVQIDAMIGEDSLSFALDNGASYSFTSETIFGRLINEHPEWPKTFGAVGCANIWGWWPMEESWPVVLVPELSWDSVILEDVGIVGLPNFFPNGISAGEWYSYKTARPVDGFLGPNAFKAFRITIDFAEGAVYFEKKAETETNDMDIVGLTLRLNPDGNYAVVGVAQKDGKPTVTGVEPGDVIVQVDRLKAQGATMGTVVDALRGKPGDIHVLILERDGKQFTVEAKVERFL